MANEEHLALVRLGAGALREWRQARPKARLDLTGASLNSLDLSQANLEGADLTGASFYRSSLAGANLRRANLRGVSFDTVALPGADMVHADLRGANARGVDFSRANLSWAALDSAIVSANLSHATLQGASLRDTNLIKCRPVGRESVRIVPRPNKVAEQHVVEDRRLPRDTAWLHIRGLRSQQLHRAAVRHTRRSKLHPGRTRSWPPWAARLTVGSYVWKHSSSRAGVPRGGPVHVQQRRGGQDLPRAGPRDGCCVCHRNCVSWRPVLPVPRREIRAPLDHMGRGVIGGRPIALPSVTGRIGRR